MQPRTRENACRLPDCGRVVKARDLCDKHYVRCRDFVVTYGIDLDGYLALYELQGGQCGICGYKPADPLGLDVDHNHTTGQIRGLLCGKASGKGGCNPGLGAFMESADTLRRAAEWIENEGPGALPTAAEDAAVGVIDGGGSQHGLG